ncbi:MAG: DUF4914 family protein, partial [Breznakibacter sp.]|nr:DUF4914 family protein [Breznakibacter sp.]
NLLLEQMLNTPKTKYLLIPNQYIGAYKVGFMAEWIDREYMGRHGSKRFLPNHLVEAKCPVLGYTLESLKIDGTFLPSFLLRVNEQVEVGEEGYEKGSKILVDFFKQEAKGYYSDELHPIGRQIIETLLMDGTLEDYLNITPY